MKYFSRIVLLPALLITSLSAKTVSSIYNDLTIISQTSNRMVIDWEISDFKMDTTIINNKEVIELSFDNGEIDNLPGYPALPQRLLTLGIPPQGDLSAQIISYQTEKFNNVLIKPIPYSYKDKDVNKFDFQFPDSIYSREIDFPETIIKLNQPTQIRDIKSRQVTITPFNYNPQLKQLTVYTKIRLQINYKNVPTSKHNYVEYGILDKFYKQIFINFEQAKHWQIINPKSLGKIASIPEGDYYDITISEDGIYKIPASTVSDNSGVPISAIQMFSNGGHMLNPNTVASDYNYPSVSEVAIMVQDINNNGLFDGNDYILFYGKSVNSWFYNSSSNDFVFQQHLYDTKNHYMLSFAGISGKRMPVEIEPDNPNAAVLDYFINRYHFEEDKYNLLASGPDWYGHRFVDRADSYSKSFDMAFDENSGISATFKAQLKGGAGITYPAPSPAYKYTFNFTINGSRLTNRLSLYNGKRKATSITVNNSIVKNGSNTVLFEYTANKSGASAYVDWFEMLYPQSLEMNQNYLNIYTNEVNRSLRYPLKSASGNNIFAFDVSDPIKPVIIKENLTPENGIVNLDLSAGTKRRNIIITSLSSEKIKSVSNLTKIDLGNDLLSASNSADFIIITHKDFINQAERIAELRSSLKTTITSVENIYRYFNGGVADPTAIRNFIRYAYDNWQNPRVSYVLLLGDGQYDYRNISLKDIQRVPPFEIYAESEVNSRLSDNYFVDVNFSSNDFDAITPDIAIGRLPVESKSDAEHMIDKLVNYENNPSRDGWQTSITLVADDEKVSDRSDIQWIHQEQTEKLAHLSEFSKFNIKKVYLSAYPAEAGGLRYIKPGANRALIDNINQGTLIVSWVGHGSPIRWAHEDAFNMNRDLERINNEGKLCFFAVASCDFGKFDDPHEPSFSEALIWKKTSGAIGVLSSTRLVYSGQNFEFIKKFYRNLFPSGKPSIPIGLAKFLSTGSSINDQKYHLLCDPSMRLADPRSQISITSISPDTLKALSVVDVKGKVITASKTNTSFRGGAVLIVNDARYDSITTGGDLYYTLEGPLLFKGEVSVEEGEINGKFIIPKSIRYKNKKSGRITIYAWDSDSKETAIGVTSNLLINGSNSSVNDPDGPEIDVYFKNQEDFSSGDYINRQPTLLAEIYDDHGINVTGETGHNVILQIDEGKPINLSGYFIYNRNSFQKGMISYPMSDLGEGSHRLKITAFDNLNNPGNETVDVQISKTTDLFITDVVNYPNPFRNNTKFTFQTNRSGADVTIKIYTVSGRLIRELDGLSTVSGYNELPDDGWNGRDEDGDAIANGVYLYKLIVKDGNETKEMIEKMVLLK